jgi:hypothetical protein
MGRWGDELFKEAYSFIPQSTVADKLNRHGLVFLYQQQDMFKKVELLNQVHDSVVFQIPLSAGPAYAATALELLKANLEQPIKWRSAEFVIPADISVGTNLGDMKEVPRDVCATYAGLYNYLHELYRTLGAAAAVQTMDSYSNGSFCAPAQVCTDMGDSALLS